MISDYFPPEKRSTAMAVFSMGVYLGIMIGLLVGGVIDRYYGWRIAFMVVGLPGVFFALLIFLTVKEPDRGRLDQKEKSSVEALPFLSTVKIIFGHKTFIYLAFGGAAVAFVQYGIGNWIPPFLSRYHGLNSMQIGILTSLIFGLGGGLGTYLGGRWSDKLSRKDVAWYFRIPLYGSLIAIPFSVVLFFSHNVYLASFFLIFPVILNALYLAPSLAVAHNLVPAHMRALSSALFFFILNLIGLGMGPLMIGYMSDSLTGALGSESLRWSLAIATSVLLLAVFCYYRASQSIVREWKSELV
jgi:predicted MFS family arabinose efflux permease